MKISGYGAPLESLSGIFRVGELAAWHAATSIIFMSILVLQKPKLLRFLGMAALVAALVGVIILTGRRKMLMTLTLYLSLTVVLLIVLRQGLNRVTGLLLTMTMAATLVFALIGLDEEAGPQSLYVQRGLSVYESTDDRWTMTLGLMKSAWQYSGLLGYGAGVAGQGARYAGQVVGEFGAAEVGIGMIIVELGLAGLLAILWLLLNLARRIWQCLWWLARTNPRLLYYAVPLLAMLITNLATFGTATQLYSDYVVLITLGLVAGVLFALLHAGLASAAPWHASPHSAYAGLALADPAISKN